MHIVLHLSDAGQGGAERQLLALLREAQLRPQSNYRHVVCLVRDGDLADEFAATAPTTILGKTSKVDVRFVRDLRRLVREVQPDIVHAWGPTPNIWGAMILATLAPWHRPKTVLAVVGLEEWRGPVLRLADRASYAMADRVVGCARAVTEHAVTRGASSRKTRTVGLGVSVPPRLERRPERGVVLLLARVNWVKGHRTVLGIWPEVLRAVPYAHLVMAGPVTDPGEQAVQDELVRILSSDSQLSRSVDLIGMVDPGEQLERSEVLVVPSISEGLPNVVLEAFAHRVPVVAHDVGGIGEVVVTGDTGWLVSADDPGALTKALIAALANRAEAQRRGDRGREEVERMTFANALRNWTAVYDELVLGAMLERGAKSGEGG